MLKAQPPLYRQHHWAPQELLALHPWEPGPGPLQLEPGPLELELLLLHYLLCLKRRSPEVEVEA